MNSFLDLITLEWFLPKALSGLGLGCLLRLIAYLGWSMNASPFGCSNIFGYALQIIAVGLAVGIPGTFLSVVFIGNSTNSQTVMTVSTYLVSLAFGYLAISLQYLLDRIQRV